MKFKRPITAVVSHSQFLSVKTGEWDEVMVGNSDIGRGILAQAARQTILHKAQIFYLCSGTPTGKYDQEFHPDPRPHLASLLRAEAINCRLIGVEPEIMLGPPARNTAEEIRGASEAFFACDVERIIFVTAPKHAPRTLLEALYYQQVEGGFRGAEIVMVPSQVNYRSANMRNVCVLEDPHRPDAEKFLQLAKYAKSIFQVVRKGPEVSRPFLQKLGNLLEEFEVAAPVME